MTECSKFVAAVTVSAPLETLYPLDIVRIVLLFASVLGQNLFNPIELF